MSKADQLSETRKSLLVLGLLASLVVAAPAHAGWKLDRAKAIAAIVWNNPCNGNVRVLWPQDFAGNDVANVPFGRCDIRFNPNNPLSWPTFCRTMLHEYGHLAGFRDVTNHADPIHSSNGRSVMAVGQTVTHLRDSRCRKNGRPFLERHGVPVA